MHLLDVIDETYIAERPGSLRPKLCDEAVWATWFPGLELSCFDDRDLRGKRWTVSGALAGTCEIWLEDVHEGTVVHAFIQADPAGGPVRSRARTAAALHRGYAHALKSHINAVKDEIDARRAAGLRPAHLSPAAGRDGRVAEE